MCISRPQAAASTKGTIGGEHVVECDMSAISYSRLAGAIFGLVAILQLVRALAGWPITISGIMIPLWASWIACVVAAGLAWLGFTASRA